MNTKKTIFLLVSFAILLLVAVIIFSMTQKESAPVQPVAEVTPEPQIEAYTIAAFGDSLTAWYGIELVDSYPTILEKKLQEIHPNIRVLNMGVSGETSTAWLDRLDFVISQKPSLVLLELGANDMFRTTNPDIVKANLAQMLKRFAEEKIPVVLMGMKSVASNGAAYSKSFNAIYPALAKEFDVPLVPFFLEGVALDPKLTIADRTHPNRAGYEKVVNENILPILGPLLGGEGRE